MAGAGFSFTTRYRGMSRVLMNKVAIESIGLNSINKEMKWEAIWDTGATSSVITKKVIQELNLKPVSVGKALTPQGEYYPYCYYIDLTLPNRVTVKNLLVMEGQPACCDILIGMDVISQGDFAVTNHNGKTTFSFRMPSMSEIDFINYNK
ncbi:MAG: hypothetical protein HDT29_06870 [Clostridiales bacterium]|nr:hypothetical protein [Clostridiales bacterium]